MKEHPIKGWVKASERLPEKWAVVIAKNVRTGKIERVKYMVGNNGFNANDYDFLYKECEWLDETPVQSGEERLSCGICGGLLVKIRGRYPKEEKRDVCPTCNTERLEQINEISSKSYGVAMKETNSSLLSSEQNVQASVATEDHSSNADGKQKKL